MAVVLILILQLATVLFVARAVLSWFQLRPDSALYPVQRAIFGATEPVLAPIRRVLPRTGGFDFSILIAILVINFLLLPAAASL